MSVSVVEASPADSLLSHEFSSLFDVQGIEAGTRVEPMVGCAGVTRSDELGGAANRNFLRFLERVGRSRTVRGV